MTRFFVPARAVALVFILVPLPIGCGGANQKRPVSGSVQYNGQSLAAGSIFFASTDPAAPCNAGGEIAEGRFSISAEGGLLPGKYLVRVSAPVKKDPSAKPRPDGSFEVMETLPARYNAETELTVEVSPSRSAVFNFELKSVR